MNSLRTICCGVAFTLLFGAAAQSQTADKRFLILLIGPTGSGKTTQAEFLKQRFRIPIIAVDDLIQANPAALAKFRRPGITPGPPQLNPAVDGLVAESLRAWIWPRASFWMAILPARIRRTISPHWRQN